MACHSSEAKRLKQLEDENRKLKHVVAELTVGERFEPDPARDHGRAFNGRSGFIIAVDPANVGVRLRRRLARCGNGMQTAEVIVDWAKVERPRHVVFNSWAAGNQTWADSDFEIRSALTRKIKAPN